MEELLTALREIQARCTRQDKVTLVIEDRNLIISGMDDRDNTVEAILNDGQNLFAKFRHTERLMSMKKKGSL